MNRRQAVLVLAVAVVTSLSLEAFAQGGPAPAGAKPPSPPIATVGPRTITRDEWARRCQVALAEFAKRNSVNDFPAEVQDLVRRQVLESQIRIDLLALEAKRTGVTVPEADAEAILKQDPFFSPGGKFDEQRFLAVKTGQAEAWRKAVEETREQLAARKLNDQVGARFRPSDETLRRQVERTLSRATLDVLSLPLTDFDGSYPEPREQDVLAWYRAHANDYRRPDRATLTVAFVNSPGLSDSIRSLPGGEAAWTRRMKDVADSLLAEVKAGRTLEQAAGFLGPRPHQVVTSDNYPGYWRAGEDVNRQLYLPANVGKVLPQALPAAEGWLLVRVDDVVPAHVAPLADVAREIRGVLRRDRRAHHAEYEEREIYARVRDSLAAPGWRFRVAVLDTAEVAVPEPSASDLDRYYRGHLADYSSFDAKSGAIVSRPFAEVRDEIASRWRSDRRRLEVRLGADDLVKAWRAGRKDAKLEARWQARDLDPAVHGADLGLGAGNRAVTDSVWSYADPVGPGLVETATGWIVWKSLGRVDRVVPTFEQARPLLAERNKARAEAEEEAGARRLFEADASRFAGGKVVHFSRFGIRARSPMEVSLTRAEVEKYQREHLDRYSAPELVTARHILVAPGNDSREADQAAHRRAEELLRRAKSGEDFATLAKQYSDDPATRDSGGDLGTFGRGTMLPAFEDVVFALQPGEFAKEPIRTTLGWHVVYCVDHVPAVVHDLDWIYMIVGGDAAREKSRLQAAESADSLFRVLPDAAAAKAAAARLGEPIQSFTKRLGESSVNAAIAEYYRLIDQAEPGHLVRRVDGLPGNSAWVTWVDSISAAGQPDWEGAKGEAMAAYRRGAGRRALEAKRAEMDSLAAQGWSVDSLAALWGGLDHYDNVLAGRGLPNLGGASVLDSLVFGGDRAPALEPGQTSGWVDFPGGLARVRFDSRVEPTREQLMGRMNTERDAAIERGLIGYFEGLKKRWPVRILDPKMRTTSPVQPVAPGAPARR